MIRVIVKSDEQGPCSVQMNGHSGYAEEGSDIVCAAASVLITTCVNAMERLAGVKPQVRQIAGAPFLSVSLPGGLEGEKAVQSRLLLEACLLGLRDVAEQYPKYIQIN